ncbi:hypothetical protein BOW53_09440 [Solemya pervernicosa gill symbiont]|uniref:Chemotaxis methyl-accepting receptor HlyB-like 4HB MCP domain-containing protein n=2 Tax=Gammaproteobacteria incertae sedis TaxID=118884 RepID=A0A1T2L4F6_9GAMM|nr:hypothetical protein [Candidatus Reidiella endopervernicosa]OOZ39988.1 hypothetical protein BOW53_09440 [Solemya pervernicosa gill symbiont]QKQ27788.1 hypothetical protein HUE57_16990 [Candidatus Reidiella endopervernicosa]
MNNMSMKNKFALVCSILALAVIVQGIIIFTGSNSIINESKQIANNEIPILNKAHQLKLSVVQVQQWLTDISATRALDGLNDGFDEAEANAALFKQLLSELKELDTENRAYTNRCCLPLSLITQSERRWHRPILMMDLLAATR